MPEQFEGSPHGDIERLRLAVSRWMRVCERVTDMDLDLPVPGETLAGSAHLLLDRLPDLFLKFVITHFG